MLAKICWQDAQPTPSALPHPCRLPAPQVRVAADMERSMQRKLARSGAAATAAATGASPQGSPVTQQSLLLARSARNLDAVVAQVGLAGLMHAHAYAHASTPAHMRVTRTHTNACPHSTHAYAHTSTHAHMRVLRTRTHTHLHALTASTHICAHQHTHTHTRTRVSRMHTHTPTHPHTRTHTCTHTRMPSRQALACAHAPTAGCT